jgi:transposase-like protein
VHRGWCTGFIVLDGKPLSIRGEDACEHLVLDADGALLAHSLDMGKESARVYRRLLEQLKADGFSITAATTDGLPGLQKVLGALRVIHQRCHVHLLRDLRTGLQLTTKHRYKRMTVANRQKMVIYRYCCILLQATQETFEVRMRHVARCFTLNFFCLNPIQLRALKRFLRGSQNAFWHFHDDRIPTTTNVAEGYIARFNARLKTMRCFKKFENAKRVLGALHRDLNCDPSG